MSSVTESHWQTVKYALLSLLLAIGLWYVVIGSEQVEAQLDLRVDYRGLPEGLIVRDGMINRLSVRLRGPAELLRGLHSRDLTYTVDLSGVQRGANVLPLTVDTLADFKAYEVVDVTPNRLVLEVDALTERVLPLEVNITPLPDDAPLRLSHVLLEPSFVTVKGPESQIRPLEHLSVSFDPNQDMSEGARAVSVAIAGPDQVEITPPVTTLRYTLSLKTQELELRRMVQLDAEVRNFFTVEPRAVALTVEVPEGRVRDAEYLAAIRVVVRPPDGMAADAQVQAPVLVVLPAGARLVQVDPSVVALTLRNGPSAREPGSGDESETDMEQDSKDALQSLGQTVSPEVVDSSARLRVLPPSANRKSSLSRPSQAEPEP